MPKTTSSPKMTMRRQAIIAVIVVVVLIIALTAVICIPRLFDGEGKGKTTTTTTSYAKTMPGDAASAGGKWLVGLLAKYDPVLKDGMFEDKESKDGSDILEKMKNKDYSMIPHEIRDGFYWTDDSKSEGKSVDGNQLMASGYLATMTAWQLRTDALKKDKSIGVDPGLIYVDREHGTVQVPAEAYCGFPADLVIQLVWTGDGWKIDGSGTSVPVLEKLRSEQVKQLLSKTSGDGEGK